MLAEHVRLGTVESSGLKNAGLYIVEQRKEHQYLWLVHDAFSIAFYKTTTNFVFIRRERLSNPFSQSCISLIPRDPRRS